MLSRRQFAHILTVGLVGVTIWYLIIRDKQVPVEAVHEPVLSAGPLPANEQFAELARTDPIAALDASLRRYREQVHGYRAVLHKQERIGGKLYEQEGIRIAFRESPFSVLMLWDNGARRAGLGTVRGSLYVKGQHDGDMIGWRPDAFLKKTTVSTRESRARDASRFSIEEFGLYHGALRTYRAWTAARDSGAWNCKYIETKAIPELDGHVCHVIQRICEPDEFDAFLTGEKPPVAPATTADSFHTITIMLDAETWLQTGAILERANRELVASYFFRDVQLNPTFPADQFTKEALK